MNAKALLALLLLFSIYGTVFSADTWYSPAWQYRRAITLNETRNITRINEPAYVTIAGTDGKIANCTKELRITDANGTEIPSQVDSDSVAGGAYSCTAVFMANSSALGSNTYYAYYGNPSAAAPNYPSLDSFFSVTSSLLKNSYYNLPIDSYGFPYPSFSPAGSGSYSITMATGRPYCDNQRWMFSLTQNGTGYSIGSGGGCTNPASSWSVGKNGSVFKEVQANFGTNPSATYYWRTRLFPQSRHIEVFLDARLSAPVNLTYASLAMVPASHSTAWDQYSSVSSTTMYANTNSSWGTYGSGSVIFGNVRNVTLSSSVAGWEGGVGLHDTAYLLAMPSNALTCASYPCTYTYSFRLAWTTDYTVAANRITGNMLDSPLYVSVGAPQSFFISVGISPTAKTTYPNTNETFSLWLNNNQSVADNFTLSCTGTCYYSENPVSTAAQQNKSVMVTITSAGVSGTTAYLITAASAANASNFAGASASLTVDATTWRSQWADAYNNTYAYRTPITVTNNGSALTDYQVPINISGLVYNNSGLVGSWHFNEGAGTRFADSSRYGNDGTYNGETFNTGTLNNFAFNTSSGWADGKYGKALRFDGTNDYVDIPNSASLANTGSFTIAGWVRTTQAVQSWIITKSQTGNPNYQWYVTKLANGAIRCYITPDGFNTDVYRTGTIPVNNGEWQHFACVYDASGRTLRLYINGTEDVGTLVGTVPASTYNAGRPVQVGALDSGTAGMFNGLIDEPLIYNRALSQQEIQQVYQNNTFIRNGLVGYWRFDEGSGTVAQDTHHVATQDNMNGAKAGNALSFDGSNDYAEMTDTGSLAMTSSNKVTLAAWIKLDRVQTGGIIVKGSNAFDSDGAYRLLVEGNSYLRGDIHTVNPYTGAVGSAVLTPLVANRWYYAALTYDGSTTRLYLDGALIDSRSDTGNIASTTKPLRIGTLDPGTGLNLNGTIDEVRVYNRALSAQEIQQLYSAGKLKLDYGDLRFVNSSGVQLPYWIENDNRAWARAPYVPNGTSTIYAYYGSPGAASASSGNATFNVFEDFSQDGTNPPTGWTRLGTAAWDASNFYMDNNNAGNQQKITYKAGQTLTSAEWQWKYYAYGNSYQITKFLGTTAAGTGGSHQELNAWSVYNDFNGNAYLMHGTGSNYDYVAFSGLAVNSWGYIRVRHVDGGGWNVDASSDGQVWVNKLSNVMSSYAVMSNPVVFGAQEHNTNNYGRIDDIRVRRYASPEPTGALLLEESSNPFAILGVSPASKTTSPNYNETFSLWAYNNQTVSDTFTLSCAGTCSVSPSSLPLASYQNGSAAVTITSANASGTTNYQITATSQANASNFASISVSLTVDTTKWRDQWADAYGNVFRYRIPVTVTNTGSALADYQVGFAIDTASPISAGKMGGDCGGIRITNGTNEIPYWVESGCNTTSTVVWARDPYIPAGNSTIYAYYGSSLVAGASNGTNTFDFFDDFPGSSLDPAKWTSGAFSTQYGTGSVTVSNSVATVTGGTNTWWGMFANGAAFTTPPFTVEFLFKGASGPQAGVETTGTINPAPRDTAGWYDGAGYGSCNNNVCNTEGTAPSLSSYSLLRIDVYGGGIKYFVNRSLVYTKTTNVPDEGMKVYMAAAQPAGKAYTDWVFIRKYAPSDPAVLAGAEQAKGYRTLVRRCGLVQTNATVTAYQGLNVSGSCLSNQYGICTLEISAGMYDLQLRFADNSTAWKNGTAFG